jgi:hypothetical protein
VDADGVRAIETAGVRTVVRVVAGACAVVALATALAVAIIRLAPGRSVSGDGATEPRTKPATSPAAGAAAGPAAGVQSPPAAAAGTERPRRLRAARMKPAEPAPARELSAKDVIPMLRAAGEREGIAAFPPPGTKPLKRGIVVPDDYEVPEGYLRHYQATDDGEQLPPILMFDPDYQFLDEQGAPVQLPADRVVPPEMAPPGLPRRLLDPAPAR